MARCRPAPPGWGYLARWLRCSLLTDQKDMLVALASPASQIASSKTGSYFCTDPKLGKPGLLKVLGRLTR